MFLLVFGANALAPYDAETDARIDSVNQIGTIRSQYHEFSSKVKFAQGAGISLAKIELAYLFLVFMTFVFNASPLRKVEAASQASPNKRE